MKKYQKLTLLLTIYYSVFSFPVNAVCPVCTVAVGAGLGLSRYFGIDDLFSSIWIGGLLMSLSFWSKDWLEKKKSGLKNSLLFSIFIWYALTFIPLIWTKVIGHLDNTLWGIDKIVFGTVIGTVLFILSIFIDKLLRTKNNGKVYFPYQKVIIPVSLLSIASISLYFLL